MKTKCKERDGIVAYVSVGVLLVVAAVCAIAAPVWTAALPLALMVAVMRKAGWV